MPKNWNDTKPLLGDAKWEDALEWYKYKTSKEEEFNHIRLLGPINSVCQHRVEVTKKDGSKTAFPMTCSGYNPETEEINEAKCPACKAGLPISKVYFQNAIIRQLQEEKPAKAKTIEDYPDEKNKPYRQVGDKHWSPIRVVRIVSTVAGQLRNISKLNKHKIDAKIVQMDVSDPNYGCDVYIKFEKEAAPANKYDSQKGDATPLTAEEQGYKLFNLDVVKTDPKRQEKDLIRLGYLKSTQATAAGSSAPKETALTIEDDDTLPPAPNEQDFTMPELQQEPPKTPAPKDKLDSITPAQLQALAQKAGVHATDPEEIKAELRKRLAKKQAASKPCLGKFKGTDDCFECSDRTKCIDSSN